MHGIETGTFLLGVQVVVAYDHGAGITLVKLFEEVAHGSLLSRCARVGGLTADVEPALVADADRVGVVVHAVRTDHPFRTAWLYRSVTTDHVVVADTQFPVVVTAVPRVYLSGRARLVGPYCRTVNNDQRNSSHLSRLSTNRRS